MIILFPTALAASIWALTGWVINHELFAIVSSQYGNANTGWQVQYNAAPSWAARRPSG